MIAERINGLLRIVAVVMFPLIGIAWSVGRPATTVAKQQMPTCKTDWHLCKDGADIFDHYEGANDARSACMRSAEEKMKPAKVEWPTLPFVQYEGLGKLFGEADGKEILRLAEDVSEQYNGIKQQTSILCAYNLDTKLADAFVFSIAAKR